MRKRKRRSNGHSSTLKLTVCPCHSEGYGLISCERQRLWSDTEQLTQLVEALVENRSPSDSGRVYANLALSKFHLRHNRPEEAEQYMRKSGVVPESAWWILGPFDRSGGMDVHQRHTLEGAVAIDPTMTYKGKTGAVRWKQITDDTHDSFIDFGKIFGFGGLMELLERLHTGSEGPCTRKRVCLRMGVGQLARAATGTNPTLYPQHRKNLVQR